MIPKDPYMLLSYINTQLRDNYSSLEQLADNLDEDISEVVKKLELAGYIYSKEQNRFIAR